MPDLNARSDWPKGPPLPLDRDRCIRAEPALAPVKEDLFPRCGDIAKAEFLDRLAADDAGRHADQHRHARPDDGGPLGRLMADLIPGRSPPISLDGLII